jgi:hypothetical protein
MVILFLLKKINALKICQRLKTNCQRPDESLWSFAVGLWFECRNMKVATNNAKDLIHIDFPFYTPLNAEKHLAQII